MKNFIKKFLNRLSFIKSINDQLRSQNEQVRKQGAYPAGHYYSPIPAEEEVLAYVKSGNPPGSELLGIDLNGDAQRELLDEYIKFYQEIPFRDEAKTEHRYYYKNTWFSCDDAIFLYSFLRRHQPKRIIEIGSGFSSAVMLDTIDGFFSQRPEITFIEPDPERLLGLLRDSDKGKVTLIDKKIQDIPTEVLLSLESGDLLFIDSSHVVKCNSDLHHLMFEILPRLRPGVFVHFHDVFYPFEYPSEWLVKGRYWNENYFLRAFLSYNSEWKIVFFSTYVQQIFSDLVKEKMPLCAKRTDGGLCIGGGLYIQRNQKDKQG
ncbi:MAG: class I SAM-dependent methyltransferase [Verrucomicrobiota bacterium]|jgi:predicted O-methyltransferase YrrM